MKNHEKKRPTRAQKIANAKAAREAEKASGMNEAKESQNEDQ